MTKAMCDELSKPRTGSGRGLNVWYRIDASGDCWEWTGYRNTDGYGKVVIDKKQRYVHRVVWEALVGTIPDGHQIDHLCRNPPCCNPDHLQVVTPVENIRRGFGNVRKTYCPQGHRYSGENLYEYVSASGTRRRCNTCNTESQRRFRQKHPGYYRQRITG